MEAFKGLKGQKEAGISRDTGVNELTGFIKKVILWIFSKKGGRNAEEQKRILCREKKKDNP